MKGIVFDLETQRLRQEAEKSILEISWFGEKPGFASFDPAIGFMRQVRRPQGIWRKIRSKGPVQLTPWMLDFLALESPCDTFEDAVEVAWQLGSQVYYDPAYHELDAERRIDGRWDLIHRHLRLSVAMTWDEANGFRVWWEHQAPDLVDELARFPFIVGANLIGFDYTVLERYVGDVRKRLGFKTIDLLAHARWGLFLAWLERKLGSERPVTKRRIQLALAQSRRKSANARRSNLISEMSPKDNRYLWEDIVPWSKRGIRIPGYRVSLQALAKGTLGLSKMGKATDAPTLFAKGKLDELVEYCQKDVELTRNVFQRGCEHGFVNIKDLDVPVQWDELAHLLAKRKRKNGPVYEGECLKFQYKILSSAPPLSNLERLFWRSPARVSSRQK